ncbi:MULTISPECIES: excinuclease ABC subunit UvrB [Brochothrix]|uniref:UvrABC system protein B n=1 Tax=Brochothrix thermosphacta TaxID=2756 RepID=A0A1D2LJC5_BROTH|nr:MULTISPECIES: excinuclease ABC subunit UvrB [Brochothrix]ANZ94925.1 excinuclease ABC subunit B [Brochothrix thermosphacta]ANZ96774.1 excinuclease ABC subunit B [Brochothrix thermosphacta]ATF26186.1 excinuclease ABC subunit UvrB [Brochothrix thermosphacta]ATH85525.1 excinuclease ABC subunit UvrB [Brochothrix thermosphacta]EUJ38133.1 excinuclease ABC subunit B [Brochothrix thermosphacta DSM 20171 = FSL F6-1036]
MGNETFKLESPYQPAGDQPRAIEKLVKNLKNGVKQQTLLGATGTGKTFTVSNVIRDLNKPTLVIAHNKTLAGQLYSEFKEFFPENAVEYFVSYYDFFQPEAYVPSKDLYIEKDSSVNDEIDQLRHSATASLLERRDTIVIASVSCIYGLGDPKSYFDRLISLREGMEIERNTLLRRLVDIQFERNDIDFQRGRFRVRGDVVEIFPASRSERCLRIEFFGDEIERIREMDALTGEIIADREHVTIFPATHFVTAPEKMEVAMQNIRVELAEQLKYFRDEGKLIEAQRLEQRTNYDLEMLEEIGYCSGVENYSRQIELRPPGSTPHTLIDYFPDDFQIIIDESHVTMPQIRGMFNGDQARKQMLVDYGFRLPSALDNRPLRLEEFEEHVNQITYISATPGPYELEQNPDVIEQIIRPTGLLDPEVEIRPIDGQIDDLIGEINKRIEVDERVLITTLTKRMSEDLTDYLKELGIKVQYLHSEVKTIERLEILQDLRRGKFDVLVGINLLREGIDIPEVSLVAILDADKEGFLRSERSLIQTMGRAARNANGHVLMYANRITDSMQKALDETERRRIIQKAYNEEHGITPTTIKKAIHEVVSAGNTDVVEEVEEVIDTRTIAELEDDMKEAARMLDFETAAAIRDKILALKTSDEEE